MASAWHATHKEPPTLGGQVFHYNASPNRYALPAFYELHVWAWRDNPGGTFADWNTRVTCSGDEGSDVRLQSDSPATVMDDIVPAWHIVRTRAAPRV